LVGLRSIATLALQPPFASILRPECGAWATIPWATIPWATIPWAMIPWAMILWAMIPWATIPWAMIQAAARATWLVAPNRGKIVPRIAAGTG